MLLCSFSFVAGSFLGDSADRKVRLILPHFSLNHDQPSGFLEVRGTWELEAKDDGFPNQTTTLHCWRTGMYCFEVSAVLSQFGFMPLDINRMKIVSWSEQVVVVCGSTALLTAERYTIDLLRQSVHGAVGPRSDGNDCPDRVTKRMNLIDGHRRSLPALVVESRQ